jgi:hypothetical protein
VRIAHQLLVADKHFAFALDAAFKVDVALQPEGARSLLNLMSQ